MRSALLPALVAAILILSGCAATGRASNVVTYSAPSFNEQSITQGKIALLPVVAGSGVEGYRRPFGDAMDAAAASVFPAGSYLTWNQTMTALNDANLVNDYQAAISAYASTSIVPRDLLSRMAEATGARYFMYVALQSPTSESQVRRSYLTGGVATDTQIGVSAFGQVWDSQGDVAWEGTGESRVNASSDAFQTLSAEERDLGTHSRRAATALVHGVMGLPAP